ncbi:hypothetical protein [Saccharopolyspora shandongensis]|uniref:WXG100-like domain-containing protein n=1 Tax=Saccharopolyspora shandongensis TaxID=418495 RepID=UPI0033D6A7B1
MSLYLDPEGAKVFAGLTGSEWPEADEDKLKDLDGEYKAAAEALRSLQRHLNDYVAAINAGFAGDAAEEFGQYARQYITTDESGLSTLEKVAAAADSFGDFLFETSAQVRYMKAQAIGQMILMAIEIAAAIAMAFATGGLSLLKIPFVKAITSALLRFLLQLVVATIMSLAFELVAGWLLDLAIQSELIKQGLQHGWNQDLTTGAIKGAAVSGSIGGVASMGAAALGKAATKYLGKTLAKFDLTSEFSKKLLNVGDHAADSITKQFGKSASDTGTTALSKSVTETSTSTTGSLSKSTTDNLAGSLPKLGDDLAAATKNFSTHFLTGFGNGTSHGIGKGGLQSLTASAGFRFKEAVSTAFEKHLTGALGKAGAKSAGEAFGEAVTKNAGKTGQGGFELGLATAMHPYRKELGENAFNALTKGYSDSIHSGLSHIRESTASHLVGSIAGSPIFGLQGFLGDGAGSAVNGEEWDPSWESFTGGAISGAAEMLGETLVADKVKEQLLQNNLTLPLMMKNFFDSGGTTFTAPVDTGFGGSSGPGSAISTESSSFSDSSSTFSDSSTVVDHGGTGSLDTLESAANIETQPLLGNYGDWMSDTGSDYGESHFDDVPDLIDLDAELDPVTGEPLSERGPNDDQQVAFSPGAVTSPSSMTTSTGPAPAVTSTSTPTNPQNPGAQPNPGQRNTGQQNPVSQVTEAAPKIPTSTDSSITQPDPQSVQQSTKIETETGAATGAEANQGVEPQQSGTGGPTQVQTTGGDFGNGQYNPDLDWSAFDDSTLSPNDYNKYAAETGPVSLVGDQKQDDRATSIVDNSDGAIEDQGGKRGPDDLEPPKVDDPLTEEQLADERAERSPAKVVNAAYDVIEGKPGDTGPSAKLLEMLGDAHREELQNRPPIRLDHITGVIAYDLRQLQVDGKPVLEFTHKIYFVGTEAQRGAVQDAAEAALDLVANRGYRFESGEQFHARVEFTDDRGNAHMVVKLVEPQQPAENGGKPVKPKTKQDQWVIGDDPKLFAHEILHAFGLPDEAVFTHTDVDAPVFNRSGDQSRVRDSEFNIMGSKPGTQATVLDRHLKQVYQIALESGALQGISSNQSPTQLVEDSGAGLRRAPDNTTETSETTPEIRLHSGEKLGGPGRPKELLGLIDRLAALGYDDVEQFRDKVQETFDKNEAKLKKFKAAILSGQDVPLTLVGKEVGSAVLQVAEQVFAAPVTAAHGKVLGIDLAGTVGRGGDNGDADVQKVVAKLVALGVAIDGTGPNAAIRAVDHLLHAYLVGDLANADHTIGHHAVLQQMTELLGTSMGWQQSSAESNSDFAEWARGESPERPGLDEQTQLNCWESVLLAAHHAGWLPESKIREIYEPPERGNWLVKLRSSLLPQSQIQWAGAVSQAGAAVPQAGHLVIFGGRNMDHVALATGKLGADGSPEVITFGWENDQITDPDKVQTATLAQFTEYESGGIWFGPGPWERDTTEQTVEAADKPAPADAVEPKAVDQTSPLETDDLGSQQADQLDGTPTGQVDVEAEAQRLLSKLNDAALPVPMRSAFVAEWDYFGSWLPKPPPGFMAGHDYSELSAAAGIRLLEMLDLANSAVELTSDNFAPQAIADSVGDNSVKVAVHEPADPSAWTRAAGKGADENAADQEALAADKTPGGGLPPLPDKLELPLVRNSIWFGGPLVADSAGQAQMMENLQASAAELNEHGGRVVLWTDVSRSELDDPAAQQMVAWAKQHGIVLVNVHEVFNSESPMRLQTPFLVELSKGTKAGYAAASDILRVELLKRFGGVYSDGEYLTGTDFIDEAVDLLKTAQAYGVHVESKKSAGNDQFVLPKDHPFADVWLDLLGKNYDKTQPDLMESAYSFDKLGLGADPYFGDGNLFAQRKSVMFRTGPAGLLPAAADAIGLKDWTEFPKTPRSGMESGFSWNDAVWPAPTIGLQDEAKTVGLTIQVVQTLVRELHNRPGNLHLTLVEEAVAKHERPDVVWTAALGFLASRRELAEMVDTVTDVSTVADESSEMGYVAYQVNLPPQAWSHLEIGDGPLTHQLTEYTRPAKMPWHAAEPKSRETVATPATLENVSLRPEDELSPLDRLVKKVEQAEDLGDLTGSHKPVQVSPPGDELSPLDRLVKLAEESANVQELVDKVAEKYDLEPYRLTKPLPPEPKQAAKLPFDLATRGIVSKFSRLVSVFGVPAGPSNGRDRAQVVEQFVDTIVQKVPLDGAIERNSLHQQLTDAAFNLGEKGVLERLSQRWYFELDTVRPTADGFVADRRGLQLQMVRTEVLEVPANAVLPDTDPQKSAQEESYQNETSIEIGRQAPTGFVVGVGLSIASYVAHVLPVFKFGADRVHKYGERFADAMANTLKFGSPKKYVDIRTDLTWEDDQGLKGSEHLGTFRAVYSDAFLMDMQLVDLGDTADTRTGDPVPMPTELSGLITGIFSIELGDLQKTVFTSPELPSWVKENKRLRTALEYSLSEATFLDSSVKGLVHGRTITHHATHGQILPRNPLRPTTEPPSVKLHVKNEVLGWKPLGTVKLPAGVNVRRLFESMHESSIGSSAEGGLRVRAPQTIDGMPLGGEIGPDGTITVGPKRNEIITDKASWGEKSKAEIDTELAIYQLDVHRIVDLEARELGAKHLTELTLESVDGTEFVAVAKENVEAFEQALQSARDNVPRPEQTPEVAQPPSPDRLNALEKAVAGNGLLSGLVSLKDTDGLITGVRDVIVKRLPGEPTAATLRKIDRQLGELDWSNLALRFGNMAHREGELPKKPYAVTIEVADGVAYKVDVHAVLGKVVSEQRSEKSIISGTLTEGTSQRRRLKNTLGGAFSIAALLRIKLGDGYPKTMHGGAAVGVQGGYSANAISGDLSGAGTETKVQLKGPATKVRREVTFFADVTEIRHRSLGQRITAAVRPSDLRPSTDLGEVRATARADYAVPEALVDAYQQMQPGDPVIGAEAVQAYVQENPGALAPAPKGMLLASVDTYAQENKAFGKLQAKVIGESGARFLKRLGRTPKAPENASVLRPEFHHLAASSKFKSAQRELIEVNRGAAYDKIEIASGRYQAVNARYVKTIDAITSTSTTTAEQSVHSGKSGTGTGEIAATALVGVGTLGGSYGHQGELGGKTTQTSNSKSTAPDIHTRYKVYVVDLVSSTEYDSYRHLFGQPNVKGDTFDPYDPRAGHADQTVLFPQSALWLVPDTDGIHETPVHEPIPVLSDIGKSPLHKDVKLIDFEPESGKQVSDWVIEQVREKFPDLVPHWQPAAEGRLAPPFPAVQQLEKANNLGVLREAANGGYRWEFPRSGWFNNKYRSVTLKIEEDPAGQVVEMSGKSGGSVELSGGSAKDEQSTHQTKAFAGFNPNPALPVDANGNTVRQTLSVGVNSTSGNEVTTGTSDVTQHRTRPGANTAVRKGVRVVLELHEMSALPIALTSTFDDGPKLLKKLLPKTFWDVPSRKKAVTETLGGTATFEFPTALRNSKSGGPVAGQEVVPGQAATEPEGRDVTQLAHDLASFQLAKALPNDIAHKIVETMQGALSHGDGIHVPTQRWVGEGSMSWLTVTTAVSPTSLLGKAKSFLGRGYVFNITVPDGRGRAVEYEIRLKKHLLGPEFQLSWDVPRAQFKQQRNLTEDVAEIDGLGFQAGLGNASQAGQTASIAGTNLLYLKETARDGGQFKVKMDAGEGISKAEWAEFLADSKWDVQVRHRMRGQREFSGPYQRSWFYRGSDVFDVPMRDAHLFADLDKALPSKPGEPDLNKPLPPNPGEPSEKALGKRPVQYQEPLTDANSEVPENSEQTAATVTEHEPANEAATNNSGSQEEISESEVANTETTETTPEEERTPEPVEFRKYQLISSAANVTKVGDFPVDAKHSESAQDLLVKSIVEKLRGSELLNAPLPGAAARLNGAADGEAIAQTLTRVMRKTGVIGFLRSHTDGSHTDKLLVPLSGGRKLWLTLRPVEGSFSRVGNLSAGAVSVQGASFESNPSSKSSISTSHTQSVGISAGELSAAAPGQELVSFTAQLTHTGNNTRGVASSQSVVHERKLGKITEFFAAEFELHATVTEKGATSAEFVDTLTVPVPEGEGSAGIAKPLSIEFGFPEQALGTQTDAPWALETAPGVRPPVIPLELQNLTARIVAVSGSGNLRVPVLEHLADLFPHAEQLIDEIGARLSSDGLLDFYLSLFSPYNQIHVPAVVPVDQHSPVLPKSLKPVDPALRLLRNTLLPNTMRVDAKVEFRPRMLAVEQIAITDYTHSGTTHRDGAALFFSDSATSGFAIGIDSHALRKVSMLMEVLPVQVGGRGVVKAQWSHELARRGLYQNAWKLKAQSGAPHGLFVVTLDMGFSMSTSTNRGADVEQFKRNAPLMLVLAVRENDIPDFKQIVVDAFQGVPSKPLAPLPDPSPSAEQKQHLQNLAVLARSGPLSDMAKLIDSHHVADHVLRAGTSALLSDTRLSDAQRAEGLQKLQDFVRKLGPAKLLLEFAKIESHPISTTFEVGGREFAFHSDKKSLAALQEFAAMYERDTGSVLSPEDGEAIFKKLQESADQRAGNKEKTAYRVSGELVDGYKISVVVTGKHGDVLRTEDVDARLAGTHRSTAGLGTKSKYESAISEALTLRARFQSFLDFSKLGGNLWASFNFTEKAKGIGHVSSTASAEYSDIKKIGYKGPGTRLLQQFDLDVEVEISRKGKVLRSRDTTIETVAQYDIPKSLADPGLVAAIQPGTTEILAPNSESLQDLGDPIDPDQIHVLQGDTKQIADLLREFSPQMQQQASLGAKSRLDRWIVENVRGDHLPKFVADLDDQRLNTTLQAAFAKPHQLIANGIKRGSFLFYNRENTVIVDITTHNPEKVGQVDPGNPVRFEHSTSVNRGMQAGGGKGLEGGGGFQGGLFNIEGNLEFSARRDAGEQGFLSGGHKATYGSEDTEQVYVRADALVKITVHSHQLHQGSAQRNKFLAPYQVGGATETKLVLQRGGVLGVMSQADYDAFKSGLHTLDAPPKGELRPVPVLANIGESLNADIGLENLDSKALTEHVLKVLAAVAPDVLPSGTPVREPGTTKPTLQLAFDLSHKAVQREILNGGLIIPFGHNLKFGDRVGAIRISVEEVIGENHGQDGGSAKWDQKAWVEEIGGRRFFAEHSASSGSELQYGSTKSVGVGLSYNMLLKTSSDNATSGPQGSIGFSGRTRGGELSSSTAVQRGDRRELDAANVRVSMNLRLKFEVLSYRKPPYFFTTISDGAWPAKTFRDPDAGLVELADELSTLDVPVKLRMPEELLGISSRPVGDGGLEIGAKPTSEDVDHTAKVLESSTVVAVEVLRDGLADFLTGNIVQSLASITVGPGGTVERDGENTNHDQRIAKRFGRKLGPLWIELDTLTSDQLLRPNIKDFLSDFTGFKRANGEKFLATNFDIGLKAGLYNAKFRGTIDTARNERMQGYLTGTSESVVERTNGRQFGLGDTTLLSGENPEEFAYFSADNGLSSSETATTDTLDGLDLQSRTDDGPKKLVVFAFDVFYTSKVTAIERGSGAKLPHEQTAKRPSGISLTFSLEEALELGLPVPADLLHQSTRQQPPVTSHELPTIVEVDEESDAGIPETPEQDGPTEPSEKALGKRPVQPVRGPFDDLLARHPDALQNEAAIAELRALFNEHHQQVVDTGDADRLARFNGAFQEALGKLKVVRARATGSSAAPDPVPALRAKLRDMFPAESPAVAEVSPAEAAYSKVLAELRESGELRLGIFDVQKREFLEKFADAEGEAAKAQLVDELKAGLGTPGGPRQQRFEELPPHEQMRASGGNPNWASSAWTAQHDALVAIGANPEWAAALGHRLADFGLTTADLNGQRFVAVSGSEFRLVDQQTGDFRQFDMNTGHLVQRLRGLVNAGGERFGALRLDYRTGEVRFTDGIGAVVRGEAGDNSWVQRVPWQPPFEFPDGRTARFSVDGSLIQLISRDGGFEVLLDDGAAQQVATGDSRWADWEFWQRLDTPDGSIMHVSADGMLVRISDPEAGARSIYLVDSHVISAARAVATGHLVARIEYDPNAEQGTPGAELLSLVATDGLLEQHIAQLLEQGRDSDRARQIAIEYRLAGAGLRVADLAWFTGLGNPLGARDLMGFADWLHEAGTSPEQLRERGTAAARDAVARWRLGMSEVDFGALVASGSTAEAVFALAQQLELADTDVRALTKYLRDFGPVDRLSGDLFGVAAKTALPQRDLLKVAMLLPAPVPALTGATSAIARMSDGNRETASTASLSISMRLRELGLRPEQLGLLDATWFQTAGPGLPSALTNAGFQLHDLPLLAAVGVRPADLGNTWLPTAIDLVRGVQNPGPQHLREVIFGPGWQTHVPPGNTWFDQSAALDVLRELTAQTLQVPTGEAGMLLQWFAAIEHVPRNIAELSEQWQVSRRHVAVLSAWPSVRPEQLQPFVQELRELHENQDAVLNSLAGELARIGVPNPAHGLAGYLDAVRQHGIERPDWQAFGEFLAGEDLSAGYRMLADQHQAAANHYLALAEQHPGLSGAYRQVAGQRQAIAEHYLEMADQGAGDSPGLAWSALPEADRQPFVTRYWRAEAAEHLGVDTDDLGVLAIEPQAHLVQGVLDALVMVPSDLAAFSGLVSGLHVGEIGAFVELLGRYDLIVQELWPLMDPQHAGDALESLQGAWDAMSPADRGAFVDILRRYGMNFADSIGDEALRNWANEQPGDALAGVVARLRDQGLLLNIGDWFDGRDLDESLALMSGELGTFITYLDEHDLRVQDLDDAPPLRELVARWRLNLAPRDEVSVPDVVALAEAMHELGLEPDDRGHAEWAWNNRPDWMEVVRQRAEQWHVTPQLALRLSLQTAPTGAVTPSWLAGGGLELDLSWLAGSLSENPDGVVADHIAASVTALGLDFADLSWFEGTGIVDPTELADFQNFRATAGVSVADLRANADLRRSLVQQWQQYRDSELPFGVARDLPLVFRHSLARQVRRLDWLLNAHGLPPEQVASLTRTLGRVPVEIPDLVAGQDFGAATLLNAANELGVEPALLVAEFAPELAALARGEITVEQWHEQGGEDLHGLGPVNWNGIGTLVANLAPDRVSDATENHFDLWLQPLDMRPEDLGWFHGIDDLTATDVADFRALLDSRGHTVDELRGDPRLRQQLVEEWSSQPLRQLPAEQQRNPDGVADRFRAARAEARGARRGPGAGPHRDHAGGARQADRPGPAAGPVGRAARTHRSTGGTGAARRPGGHRLRAAGTAGRGEAELELQPPGGVQRTAGHEARRSRRTRLPHRRRPLRTRLRLGSAAPDRHVPDRRAVAGGPPAPHRRLADTAGHAPARPELVPRRRQPGPRRPGLVPPLPRNPRHDPGTAADRPRRPAELAGLGLGGDPDAAAARRALGRALQRHGLVPRRTGRAAAGRAGVGHAHPARRPEHGARGAARRLRREQPGRPAARRSGLADQDAAAGSDRDPAAVPEPGHQPRGPGAQRGSPEHGTGPAGRPVRHRSPVDRQVVHREARRTPTADRPLRRRRERIGQHDGPAPPGRLGGGELVPEGRRPRSPAAGPGGAAPVARAADRPRQLDPGDARRARAPAADGADHLRPDGPGSGRFAGRAPGRLLRRAGRAQHPRVRGPVSRGRRGIRPALVRELAPGTDPAHAPPATGVRRRRAARLPDVRPGPAGARLGVRPRRAVRDDRYRAARVPRIRLGPAGAGLRPGTRSGPREPPRAGHRGGC